MMNANHEGRGYRDEKGSEIGVNHAGDLDSDPDPFTIE